MFKFSRLSRSSILVSKLLFLISSQTLSMNQRLAPQTTHNPIMLVLNAVMMFTNTACALEGFGSV